MIVSSFPPLLPPMMLNNVSDAGEICTRMPMEGMNDYQDRSLNGLGIALDPISNIVGAAGNIFAAIGAGKVADSNRRAQEAALREQQREAAQQLALTQAQMQAEPYADKRRTQTYALYAIGGLAAAISAGFLISTARRKRK